MGVNIILQGGNHSQEFFSNEGGRPGSGFPPGGWPDSVRIVFKVQTENVLLNLLLDVLRISFQSP
jgi:hypothetical protein